MGFIAINKVSHPIGTFCNGNFSLVKYFKGFVDFLSQSPESYLFPLAFKKAWKSFLSPENDILKAFYNFLLLRTGRKKPNIQKGKYLKNFRESIQREWFFRFIKRNCLEGNKTKVSAIGIPSWRLLHDFFSIWEKIINNFLLGELYCVFYVPNNRAKWEKRWSFWRYKMDSPSNLLPLTVFRDWLFSFSLVFMFVFSIFDENDVFQNKNQRCFREGKTPGKKKNLEGIVLMEKKRHRRELKMEIWWICC